MYDSIIVDEAQDLSPCKLRILAGLVKRQENNLFLLSDKNQRVFRLESWKKETGINIVGRTHYLTLNYRTTKQIREFADRQFMTRSPEDKYFREYKSIYLGPEPVINSFSNRQEEYRYLTANMVESKKSPYDYIVYDSGIERELALILNYLGGSKFPHH